MRGIRPPKLCRVCDKMIGSRQPVFLVSQRNGMIVGPFHAECADLIHNKAAEMVSAGLSDAQLYAIYGRETRQEKTPG